MFCTAGVSALLVAGTFMIRKKEHSMPIRGLCGDWFLTVEDTESRPARRTSTYKATLLAAIVDWRFFILSISLCILYCGLLIPFYFIVTYAESQEIPPNTAHSLFSVTYAGSVCGRLSSGWLADHLGVYV